MSDDFLSMFESADASQPQAPGAPTKGAPTKTSELKTTLQARLIGVQSWDEFLSNVDNWSVGYNEKSARAEISIATIGEDGATQVQFLSDLDARMSISSIDRKIEQKNEDKSKIVKFKDWLQKKKNEELEVIFSEKNPGFVKPRTEKEATGFMKFLDAWVNPPPKVRQLRQAINIVMESLVMGVMKLAVSAVAMPLNLDQRGWGYGGDSR